MKIQFLVFSLTLLLAGCINTGAVAQSTESLLMAKEYNNWEVAW